MKGSDSQCEETLTDFFNKWASVREKISSREIITSKNYADLVGNIGNNLDEINKIIDSFAEWKKEVAKVFNDLQPSVKQLMEGLETPNDGQLPSVTQFVKPREMANDEGKAINELKHINENVREIKNGAEHIVKLPRVQPKKKSKERQAINWRTTMLEETIMDSPAMATARSIYDGLEHQLKLCFLSLSIFPENYIIRKRSLIYWWIGEGFVDDKDSERKAEECFNKLLNSGLVEAVEEQYSRSPRSCILHPLIRRMVIEIAKEIMFFDFDSGGKLHSGPSHCARRAFVAGTSGGGEAAELRSEKVKLKPEPSKLESLFNVDVNCIELDEEDFRKLNKVKTLQLGRWMTSPEHHIELLNPIFLTHLKQLKNLRYLGLQGISRITEVADIQHLGELRVLDLRACHNLEKLPKEIAKLKKLTHLDVSECYLLEYMPKGLGDLSELQLLNGFVVNTWSKKACKVRELTKLGKLEKLSISLGMEAMVIDGVLDPIGEIKSLKSLRITWGSTPTEEENEDGTRKMKTANDPATHSHSESKPKWSRVRKAVKKLNIILNWYKRWSRSRLCLPPKLTKLDLECYPEKDPPLFKRKLTAEERLEKLYFRGGGLKSLRGMQGHEVSKVRFIRLRFLKEVVMEKADFKAEFPSLQIMQPHECPHIPRPLELVSPGEIASPQRKDEASTSTNRST